MVERAEAMMKRRSYIKRSTKPIPKRRKRPRVHKEIVRLTGDALERLREDRWEADAHKCTYEGCGRLLPLNGDVFTRAHLAHIKSRGAGGDDSMENTKIMCHFHHIEWEHRGGKPCPRKVLD